MLAAAAGLVTAATSLAKSEPVQAAREAIGAALNLVPEDVAHQFLTEAAIKRANAIADLKEAEKFGGFPGPDTEPER